MKKFTEETIRVFQNSYRNIDFIHILKEQLQPHIGIKEMTNIEYIYYHHGEYINIQQ